MRVLFLSRWYPYPPDNGSKLRVHSLLRGLCAAHDVTLISFRNPAERPLDPPASGPRPVETHVAPFREFAPGSGLALAGYLSATPRFLVDTHSREMEGLIRNAVRRTPFDLVVASQLSMAAYHHSFRGIPAIFEEAELGIYWPDEGKPEDGSIEDGKRASKWAHARRRLTWMKHARFMSRLLRNFDLCTVASDIECRLLAAAAPGYSAVHVVPNCVDVEPAGEPVGTVAPDRERNSLIFTGSLRFAPNLDAMTWFVDDVFPSVRARVPGAQLTITGDPGEHPPLGGPGIVLTGRVRDVRALLATSAISVAPIRTGGGTRLKILEAMAMRTPVVATAKAVEGIDARDGEHLLIADTSARFADAVHRLLQDPIGAREMADRAWQLFHARYSSGVVVPQFLRLVDRVAAA